MPLCVCNMATPLKTTSPKDVIEKEQEQGKKRWKTNQFSSNHYIACHGSTAPFYDNLCVLAYVVTSEHVMTKLAQADVFLA